MHIVCVRYSKRSAHGNLTDSDIAQVGYQPDCICLPLFPTPSVCLFEYFHVTLETNVRV